jgi:hypothetical protein
LAARRGTLTGQGTGLTERETEPEAAPALPGSVWAPAVWIAVLVLAVYLLTESSDLRNNGDTLLRWQTTQSIVDHARLWIAHPMSQGTRVAIGCGGHYYVSAYGPGQSVFMIPFYVVGKGLAALFHLPRTVAELYAARALDLVLGAALAALVFLFGSAVGYTRRVAVVVALVFAFATSAWPDAQSANEHTQVSLFALLSVYAAWRFIRTEGTERRWLVLAGTASGLSIITRYDAAIYIPVIAIWLALVRHRRGTEVRGILVDWLVYGASIIPWALIIALWNLARFGSPVNLGLHLQTFGEPPWVALPGLLVSPGKGVIWYVPLLFLLPWAGAGFYRRLPALCLLFAALGVVTLAFYANVLYWHGDPAWGPRYLYETLPYLIIPLGELLRAWRSLGVSRRSALVALGLLSISIQVAAVSVTTWRFWDHLEQIQEHTPDKFNWGPTAYTYYWIPDRSPLLWQFRDVYEVASIDVLGQTQYRMVRRPTPCAGKAHCLDNPARHYPLNTLDFWWSDIRHPLVAPPIRVALALALLLAACIAAGGLARSLRRQPASP